MLQTPWHRGNRPVPPATTAERKVCFFFGSPRRLRFSNFPIFCAETSLFDDQRRRLEPSVIIRKKQKAKKTSSHFFMKPVMSLLRPNAPCERPKTTRISEQTEGGCVACPQCSSDDGSGSGTLGDMSGHPCLHFIHAHTSTRPQKPPFRVCRRVHASSPTMVITPTSQHRNRHVFPHIYHS